MLHGGQTPGDADYYDFSFSGLKTSVLTRVREVDSRGALATEVPNLAASFQESVVTVLVEKTLRAAREKGCKRVVLGGGVAASQALRNALKDALGADGELYHPSPRLATDNGAMIARAALFHYQRGEVAGLDFTARADMTFPGLVRA